MTGSFACITQDRLRQLADDDLSPREWAELEGHVTDCVHCRAIMDDFAADGDWHQELRSALARDQYPADWPSLGDLGSEDADGLQRLLALLGPTDDPRMLGRIGPYEITGILGHGGMGVVFKGFDGPLNRYVAIKMLLPHLASSGLARKRFAREAQASAAVVNDHVMAIHAVAEWQGMPYLVMPYGRGVALQKRLDDNGPLKVVEILRIGMQTAVGLAAAHAQGLVHRDVKPANILLADGVERVTLTDFGLARAVDDVNLTGVGVLAGTPPYMSPEQALGQPVDARSDLFSLGSVLYAMCTGRAPFRADSSYGVMRLVIDAEPRPIREINPEIPDWLCAIVKKLLAKRPVDRFATASEVADLLQGCLAHLQQPANVPLPDCLSKRQPVAGPWRRILLRGGVFLLVVLSTLVLTGLLNNDSPDQPKYTVEVYQDFRGKRALLPDFRLAGASDPENYVKAEEEGLRITLPKTRKDNSQNIEIAANFVITGDFEITGTYELLDAEMPNNGWGVGVGISLSDTHTINKFLKVGRYMRPKTGSVNYAESWTKGAKDWKMPWVRTATRSGQLRLVRQGQKVRCQVSDKIGKGFTTIFTKDDFGDDDLVHLRFVVGDGNKSVYAVDARLVDLRVRYGETNNPAHVDEPGAPAPRPRSGLLAVTLLLGLVAMLTLLFGFGLLLYWRRQRTEPNLVEKTVLDIAPELVAFACSACGKNLKAKATLAGKMLKCPRCEQGVLVPSNHEPEA